MNACVNFHSDMGKKFGHRSAEFFNMDSHVDLNSCAAVLPPISMDLGILV